MGHEHKSSGSAGVLVAVVAAMMVVVFLFGLVVIGGLFFVGAQRQVVVQKEIAMAEMARAEAAVARQHAEAAAEVEVEPIAWQIQIDSDGGIRFEDEPIPLADLDEKLKEIRSRQHGKITVTISADERCQYKHVIAVIDACRGVGITDIQMKSTSVQSDGS